MAAAAKMPVEIRPLRSHEASDLVRCFERCYGDTYPADAFYNADEIRARLASGRMRSLVAVMPNDGIVGHMALTLRPFTSRTVDAGNTVVDPRYRGHGLAAHMAARLVELCREAGFVGFHHYPTTAHHVMQKLAVESGGVETGLMFGYIPAGTNYRELAGATSAQPLAVLIVYHPVAPAPMRDVFVPERYRELVSRAYRGTGLERSTRTGVTGVVESISRMESSFDARRGLLRITVRTSGQDLTDRILALTSDPGSEVVQVDLALRRNSDRQAALRICTWTPRSERRRMSRLVSLVRSRESK